MKLKGVMVFGAGRAGALRTGACQLQPPQDLRKLRLVSRYRRKRGAMCASELNRLHRILDDAGIKLGAVVSDINGVSARAWSTV